MVANFISQPQKGKLWPCGYSVAHNFTVCPILASEIVGVKSREIGRDIFERFFRRCLGSRKVINFNTLSEKIQEKRFRKFWFSSQGYSSLLNFKTARNRWNFNFGFLFEWIAPMSLHTTTQYCDLDTIWFSGSPFRQDNMDGRRLGNNRSSFLAFPLWAKQKESVSSVLKIMYFKTSHRDIIQSCK